MSLSVTTPTDREIVLTRTFAAGRDLLFEAYTRADLLTQWYGARGWNLVECEIDLREGGSYRFTSRGPGGEEMVQTGTVRVLRRPERLELTELFDDQSYPGETLITHEFTEHGGQTTVTTTIQYATPEGRDTVLRYPMARGVSRGGRPARCTAGRNRMTAEGTNHELDARGRLGTSVQCRPRPRPSTPTSSASMSTTTPSSATTPGSCSSPHPGRAAPSSSPQGLGHDMAPGSLKGVQLVVKDIHKARAELVEHGVKVSEVAKLGDNPVPGGHELDNVGFVFFDDPDGNSWAVQQISNRE